MTTSEPIDDPRVAHFQRDPLPLAGIFIVFFTAHFDKFVSFLFAGD